MKTIAFTQARANLKKIVDAAERGQVVKITRNGRVVAELHPPQESVDKYWEKRKPFIPKKAKMLEFFMEQRRQERW
jgi:prevent-host-death family protein